VPGSHAAAARRGRTRQRATDVLRETLLTLAALFGTVCLVVMIGVITLDLGVIVFRTGSMSPTIPTGAAALVRTEPADQVEVGDVVTVPSPLGTLPVTHRVVSTEQLADGTTRLRLRGDANDAEDPFPYDVTEVRRVVVSAPGVGYALVRLGDPRVMGGVTVGVALLVGWALWPRDRDREHDHGRLRRRRGRSRRRREAVGQVPGPVAGPAVVLDDAPAPALGTSRASARDATHVPAAGDAPGAPVRVPAATRAAATRAVGTLALAAVLLTGAVTAAPRAEAATDVTPPPPTGYSPTDPTDEDVLRLSSSLPLDQEWSLSPGTDLRWRVESTVVPPDGAPAAAGTLWVSLFAGGPLVELGDAVRLTLELCDGGWAADGVTCPAGLRSVDAPATDGQVALDRVTVGQVSSDAVQAVVVRLQVDPTLGDDLQGVEMTLALRFDAFGDVTYLSDVLAAVGDEGAGAGGRSGSDVLGVTGADLRPAAWGVLAVLVGAVALVWASDRRRERAARARAGTSDAGTGAAADGPAPDHPGTSGGDPGPVTAPGTPGSRSALREVGAGARTP
jgi:signal peptidase I